MASSARSRKLRWSAPFAAAVVVALIVAIPGLSAADSPSLPAISAQQLITKVQQVKPVDLSGTINMTTDLGIPNLSALSNAAGGGDHGGPAFSPTDLLAGSHKALVWLAGPDKTRVALQLDMAETDVVHNGNNIWTWDSSTKKVVHYTIAADTKPTTPARGDAQAATDPAEAVKTPQQLTDEFLANINPSTAVSMAAPISLAGQKAYQLVLAPHAGESTVDHVVIAVDSVTGLPLQVQVFAKGQKKAALSLGFSSLHYSTPAASRFAFTPPPGSTVTNKTLGGSHDATTAPVTPGTKAQADPNAKADPKAQADPNANPNAKADQPVTVGQDWTSVAILKGVQIPRQLNDFLKAATPVSGSFGQGRVLESSLVNVLVMDDGRVAVGAVSASALEAAVAAAP
jgi:outer membrane lipoprotein-sorting protein